MLLLFLRRLIVGKLVCDWLLASCSRGVDWPVCDWCKR